MSSMQPNYFERIAERTAAKWSDHGQAHELAMYIEKALKEVFNYGSVLGSLSAYSEIISMIAYLEVSNLKELEDKATALMHEYEAKGKEIRANRG